MYSECSSFNWNSNYKYIILSLPIHGWALPPITHSSSALPIKTN